MPKGFLPSSTLKQSRKPAIRAPLCGICKLCNDCNSPKMPVTGEGKRGVLIVAEAPGRQEDEQGIQLVGKAGQLLRDRLDDIGVDLDRDCWKTNAIICHPHTKEGKNRTPTPDEIDYCRPNLTRTINELDPRVIILLGGVAVRSMLAGVFRDSDIGNMTKWAGWRIPSQKPNAWICPTWHPSYLRRENNQALDLWFTRHLKAAFELQDRPWPDGPPDYASRVEKVLEPERAAKILRKMIAKGGTIGFDYETNMLKPDSEKARIVSCAVCYEGRKTIAYPWHGEAIQATSELLRSDVAKVGANIKFEQRWTKAILGHGVRNWKWDTMLGAHWIDNRSEITSVKFQAFVLLGQSAYNEHHIEPFLKSDGRAEAKYGANAPNRIDEIELGDLLIYNGLDALLEYEIAQRQMVLLGDER